MISIIINFVFLAKDHVVNMSRQKLLINYNFRRVLQNIKYNLNIYIYVVRYRSVIEYNK